MFPAKRAGLDYFTNTEWRQNASFPSQQLKVNKLNKVSKSEGTRTVEYAYHF